MLALVVSTAACATAPARPAAPAGPLRAIGRVALDDGGMRASFDVALAVAGERARLDLALPTGTAALVLWLDDARWILVDMLGREVWSGTLAELGAAWPALAPPIQAALILPGAAGTLIGADAFDTITSWRSAAAASSPTGDAWSVGFAGEPLPWTGPRGSRGPASGPLNARAYPWRSRGPNSPLSMPTGGAAWFRAYPPACRCGRFRRRRPERLPRLRFGRNAGRRRGLRRSGDRRRLDGRVDR